MRRAASCGTLDDREFGKKWRVEVSDTAKAKIGQIND
jgi:hypothetical protein